MMEMLRRVLCFIDVEPPSTKMSDFFPLTKRISVNLGGEPPIFVSARLLFGMPESVISRIQQLQDCTVQETAEVVVAEVCNMMRQCALLVERLKVAEANWTFISHRVSNGEKLRARLE
ncbi:hypothetical protein AAG906_031248 [Vitis piasezkii]